MSFETFETFETRERLEKKNSRRRRRGEKERKKDAAREQGSGPPEERVGKDTGIKKSSSSISSARDARDAFSLSFSFLF